MNNNILYNPWRSVKWFETGIYATIKGGRHTNSELETLRFTELVRGLFWGVGTGEEATYGVAEVKYTLPSCKK